MLLSFLEDEKKILLYFLYMNRKALTPQTQKTIEEAQRLYDRFLQDLDAVRRERLQLYEHAMKEVEVARIGRLRQKISASV